MESTRRIRRINTEEKAKAVLGTKLLQFLAVLAIGLNS